MARVAHREGYPEIGLYYEKAAWEEAEHAAKFAELLGEVVTDSTNQQRAQQPILFLLSVQQTCLLVPYILDRRNLLEEILLLWIV